MRTIRSRPQTSRFRVIALVAVAVFFVLFLSANGVASFYTDWLWFDNLDLGSVWTTILSTRLLLAVVFTTIFFTVLWGNLYIADRIQPETRPDTPEEDLVERYHAVVGVHAGKVRIAIAALFGLIAGVNTSSEWETWLLFRSGADFGRTDPLFARDVGFYVFRLPFWTFVVDWFFAALVLTLIVVLVAHYLNGGIRASVSQERVSSAVKIHLSVLLAVLAVLRSAAYWLDRFHLLTSSRGRFDGALATDVNIQLPAFNLLALISLFCAALFVANIRRPGWGLPAVAIGIWLVSHFAIGTIFPLVYQRVRVQPVESVREPAFVERNIEATRFAYGLDTGQVSSVQLDYEPGLSAQDVDEFGDVLRNVPVADRQLVNDEVIRREGERRIYQFPEQLDMDRYEIDGEVRPVVLSARGLNIAEVGETWESQHVIFTHGYGAAVVAAYDQEGLGDGETRQLDFLVSGLGDLQIDEELDVSVEQPRVYYGESLDGYAIVGADRQEVDYQTGDSQSVLFSYDGDGGVPMGSLLRRTAFALRFRQVDPLISRNVTDDSRVIFNRNIEQRVRELAPFLRFDKNPYPVLAEDQLFWVLDAYTTTSDFPYSQSVSTTVDPTSELASGFNYVRNSVKVVVDAYDGTVSMYVIDDEDPIINAWRSVFPDLFSDGSDMPESIRDHLRYPEDIFTVQTDMWANYVVDDATQFIQGDVAWSVATQPGAEAQQQEGETTTGGVMDPQYLMARLPDEDSSEFVLQRAFVPRGGAAGTSARPELTAIMMARSDPENYGQLVLVRLPGGLVRAPDFIHAEIRKNDDLTAFIREKAGAKVEFGEMSLLLVDDTIVYIRPVYVEANSTTAVPELQRIVAVNGDRIFMGRSLSEAIQGVTTGVAPPDTDSTETSDSDSDSGDEDADNGSTSEEYDPSGKSVVELIADADELLADAARAEDNGLDDDAADLRTRAGQALMAAQDLLGGAPATTTAVTAAEPAADQPTTTEPADDQAVEPEQP